MLPKTVKAQAIIVEYSEWVRDWDVGHAYEWNEAFSEIEMRRVHYVISTNMRERDEIV